MIEKRAVVTEDTLPINSITKKANAIKDGEAVYTKEKGNAETIKTVKSVALGLK